MTTIKLDPGAALLLDALHGAGHAAYAVGGCVRDSLLGLDPHDWDLCTSARPEQVMALFGEEKCIPTGLQHGTVTVKQGGRLYETTTFRTEGAYSDGRHPDAVCFVPDVREDLARRDFTINAMAYSAEEGLIDPFGGRDDLAAHLVRAVGEPERRFEEDALRILRLYRFAARFGFAIDPATGAAARALGPHLDCVSAERIQEELLKLLAAPRPGSYLEPAVLAVILPELEPEKQPERFAELCRTIDRIEPTAENVPARLAALLWPLGEAGARKALRKLKCSNALTDEVTALEREAGGGAGSFLLGHEFELRHPADALCLERHSHPAGRCPNSNSLFPPQAAVVAVAGHSIARPIACGNRVPPQRTVLRETPAVSDCGFVPGILSQLFKAEAGIKVHPFRRAEEKGLQALRREGVGQPDDEPPANAAPPQGLRSLAAGHVSLLRSNGVSAHGAGKLPSLLQSPDHSPAAGAL